MLVFRYENHWVSGVRDSLKWYNEVIGWISQWTRNPFVDLEVLSNDAPLVDQITLVQ